MDFKGNIFHYSASSLSEAGRDFGGIVPHYAIRSPQALSDQKEPLDPGLHYSLSEPFSFDHTHSFTENGLLGYNLSDEFEFDQVEEFTEKGHLRYNLFDQFEFDVIQGFAENGDLSYSISDEFEFDSIQEFAEVGSMYYGLSNPFEFDSVTERKRDSGNIKISISGTYS